LSSPPRNAFFTTHEQSIDESIMNMPAALQSKKSKIFWNDVNLDGTSRDVRGVDGSQQNKKNHDPQRKLSLLWRITWLRKVAHPALDPEGKTKDQGADNTGPEKHSMTRILRSPVKMIYAARDKLRVVAAGDSTRPRPSSQVETESDEEMVSPTSPVDINQRGVDSRGDDSDESQHGIVDTICFCLCLPCCK